MARFSVEAVFRGIDQISGPVTGMQSVIRRFSERAQRRIGAITDATDALAGGMARVGRNATFGAAGLLTGITLINKSTSEFETMTEAMGINSETARAVAFSAKSIGLEADTVTDLIEEMNNKLGESAGLEELGPVTESLSILGLEFENIRDLSPDEQFKAITNAALKLEDGTKAAAAADILLGGEANKIISVMRLQGGTMEEIEARFKEVNFLTEAGTKGAKKWAGSIGFTTTMFETMGQQIAGLAGDALAPMLDLLNETVSAQKDLVNEKLTEFFAEVAEKVEYVIENFSTVVTWIKRIGAVIGIFFALSLALKAIAVVLGVVNVVMAVYSAAVVASTVVTGVLNAVMLANPMGAIVVGIGLLIAAGITLMRKWDEIGDFFTELWDKISIPESLTNPFSHFSLSDLNPFADDPVEEIVKPARPFSDAPPQLISPEARALALSEEKTMTSKVDISVTAAPGSTAAMTVRNDAPNVAMSLANSGDFQ